ncbi:hypothetical protein KIH87_00260 [Paraneptunicella aestuarii]|uniref:hypothetical protein n=1 Tax=Paraneptunicella aestuarii TaxID=2831148 RepID=UPI001E4D10F6|nr:hypothetical protein [Paraneptunicella aestuarii]UAA38848.1 hypothetical protein KIH87_00260 [Paraneptunicella aestuarii]
MFNLSQRAWNNVIIFAMLLMVYLFSISNKLLVENSDNTEIHFLLPEHSIIMRMEFAEVTLERIGRSWRTKGSDSWSMDRLQSLVYQWQHLVVHEQAGIEMKDPYIVTMLLAGEDKSRVFQLFPLNGGVLINSSGKTVFVADTSLEDLVPQ